VIVGVDTSSLVAYLSDTKGRDVDCIDSLLEVGAIILPPVVVTEILSDPKLPLELINIIKKLPQLELSSGYWERAAMLRAKVISSDRKARLGDALIAQSCIEHKIPLITRDKDFKAFHKLGGLALY
jgi:predicted nucleic acid-binding protein